MAGQKKSRMDLARLEAEEGLGEAVMGMLEEGKAIARICAATGLGKKALTEWLEAPERAALASRARARAADALVAESLEIVDEAGTIDPETLERVVTSEAIQHAKLRATTRQWIAERWNRDVYGAPKTTVQVNIGQLHLDALRAVGSRKEPLPLVEVIDQEPEVIEHDRLDEL